MNKCAYFDYQRDRIFARTHRVPRSLGLHRTSKTKRRISLATTVSQFLKRCTVCGSPKILCEKSFVRWVIDLKWTTRLRIDVKKWQPRYLFLKYRCEKCGERFTCPDVPSLPGAEQYTAMASCVGAYITILWVSSRCSACIAGSKIFLT